MAPWGVLHNSITTQTHLHTQTIKYFFLMSVLITLLHINKSKSEEKRRTEGAREIWRERERQEKSRERDRTRRERETWRLRERERQGDR